MGALARFAFLLVDCLESLEIRNQAGGWATFWTAESSPWFLARILPALLVFLAAHWIILREMSRPLTPGAHGQASYPLLAIISIVVGLVLTYSITALVSFPLLVY